MMATTEKRAAAPENDAAGPLSESVSDAAVLRACCLECDREVAGADELTARPNDGFCRWCARPSTAPSRAAGREYVVIGCHVTRLLKGASGDRQGRFILQVSTDDGATVTDIGAVVLTASQLSYFLEGRIRFFVLAEELHEEPDDRVFALRADTLRPGRVQGSTTR